MLRRWPILRPAGLPAGWIASSARGPHAILVSRRRRGWAWACDGVCRLTGVRVPAPRGRQAEDVVRDLVQQGPRGGAGSHRRLRRRRPSIDGGVRANLRHVKNEVTLLAAALLVASAGSLVLAAVVAPGSVSAAPGTPGTPQPPTTVVAENFQNRPGPSPIVRLTGYAGPSGQTYTAAPTWLVGCNGWVASANQATTAAGGASAQIADCGSQGNWNAAQQLAQALGIAAGPEHHSGPGQLRGVGLHVEQPGCRAGRVPNGDERPVRDVEPVHLLQRRRRRVQLRTCRRRCCSSRC